jgi:hypothetical protein
VVAPWLRWLVANQSLQSPEFLPDSTHMGYVVDKVALGQIFLRVLRFSPVSIIPPSLSTLVYHLADEQYVRLWQQFRDAVSLHR